MEKQRKTCQAISIDSKIQNKQNAVIRAKSRYDKAVSDLEALMKKRYAIRTKEFWAALAKSGKTYDDVLRFLNC